MYLLGTVLSHFLSLYASVNSFHMLTVVDRESQETWKRAERIGSILLSAVREIPRQIKEQNDPLAQVFHNARSYNFFAYGGAVAPPGKG